MREAVSASMPPYPPTIPHMSLRSTPGSGKQATLDVTRARRGCRCYARIGAFDSNPLIVGHLADTRERVWVLNNSICPADRVAGSCGEETAMAEVIQGVFPGGEGPDGTLPGVSAVAALNLSPKPGDATWSCPSSSPAHTPPSNASTSTPRTPSVARAPGSSPASPRSLGSTSPTVSPRESPAPP